MSRQRPLPLLRPALLSLCLTAMFSPTLYADDYQDAWKKAQQLIKENDRRAAIIELRNALQEQPNSIDARLLLGELYYQDGNLPAAEKELNKARELKAPKARWQKLLGRTWLSTYQPQKVLEHITEVSSDPTPMRAEALALRGLAVLQQGSIEDAEKVLLQATSLQATQADASYGLAQIARLRNDLDKAETLVQQGIKSDPTLVNNFLLETELQVLRGQREEAIKTINKAVELSPNDARIRLARAETLIGLNQVKEAWPDINLVLTAAPKHPVGLYLKAKAQVLEKKPIEALASLEESLAVMPNYVEAHLLAGYLHVQQRQWRQAEEKLGRALAVRPDNLGATKLMAQTKLGLRDPKGALAIISTAQRKHPDDIQLLAYQATALIQMQEFDKASEVMERAVALAPDADNLRTGLALLQLQSGESGAAVTSLELASKDNAELQISDLMLVSTYMSQRQTDKAVQLAESLFKKHPDNALAANVLGVVKLSLNDYAKAGELFTKAVELKPGFLTAQLNQARVDVAQKNYDAALKKLQALHKQNSTLNVVALQIAQVYDLKGDREQGMVWQKKAWELDTRSISAGTAYLRRLLQAGKPMDALSVAQQMVASNPDGAEAHYALGLAQRANKNVSSAVAAFRKAIALNNKNAEYYFALGDTLADSGDSKGAVTTLENLLRLQPDNWQAHLAIGRIALGEKRFDEAHKRAAEVSKKVPQLTVGLELDGETLIAEGKPAEAAKVFEKAYKQIPSGGLAHKQSLALQRAGKPNPELPLLDWLKQHADDNNARANLAIIYQGSGQLDKALEQYKLLEAKLPKDPIILNNMTYLHCERNDMANIKAYLTKLEALKLTQPSVLDTQGYAYLKLGDANKALQLFEAALKAVPESSEFRYHAAMAKEKLGKKDEAKALLKAALASKTPFSERAEAEAMLKRLP